MVQYAARAFPLTAATDPLQWIFVLWLMIGLVLPPLALWVALFRLLDPLLTVVRERKELAGKVRRKWIATAIYDLEQARYVRVGEWPFQVSRDVYDSLSEGDDVVALYWSYKKKVIGVDKQRS